MKINFLQSGGIFYSSIANPASPEAKKDREKVVTPTTTSDDNGILPKTVLNKLYDEGIPVDFNEFALDMEQFSNQDFSKGVNKRALYEIQSKANELIKQSAYLKTAADQAYKNGSLDEYAVDQRGYMYVIDTKHNISKIHMREYDAKKMYEEGKSPLTVSELLRERQFNPQLAWNYQIADVIANSIGQEKINDFILDVIAKIGNNETVKEAYLDIGSIVGKDKRSRTLSNTAFEQLQSLYGDVQALGPDAIVKLTNTDKGSNYEAALNYIVSIMPNNMKTQMMARNVIEGGDYKDGYNFIGNIVAKSVILGDKSVTKREIDVVSGTTKKAGSGTGSSSKTFYQSPNEMLFDGNLNRSEITLTDRSSNNRTAIKVQGNEISGLTTDNGNAVSNMPLGLALQNTISKYGDINTVYVGNQKFDFNMLNTIAYGQDGVACVYMPSLSTGEIDWDSINGFSKAENEILEKNLTSIEDKNKVHGKYGSFAWYDENGKMQTHGQTTRYILTYGYCNDDELDESNGFIEHLTKEQKDGAKKLMELVFNKKLKKDYKITNSNSIFDDIYKVPVFIKANPFASELAATYAGHGPSMIPRTLEQDMTQQMVQATPQTQMIGSTDLLYNVQ